MQDTIRFVLDDRIVELGFPESSGLKPTTTVLTFLRSQPIHKGVKEGCAEGDCGACTIVVAELDKNGQLIYRTIDSCLVFLPMIHGKQIITVENLSVTLKKKKYLHPVQQMMIETNGSQCGYCTPGIVMSLFGLYKNHSIPSPEIIEDALTGNLCRCTGYHPILEAALRVCRERGQDHFSQNEPGVISLLNSISANTETIEIKTGNQYYFKPFNLSEALRLRSEYPGAIVVTGSTDVALNQTKRKELLPGIIDLSGVNELCFFREETDHFVFGSGVTLERIKIWSKDRLPPLFNMLRVFGSLQIRNIATLGGNVGSASPIGDTLPLLIALGAKIKVNSKTKERIIGIEDFIKGYRKTDLLPDELIIEIVIPKYDAETRILSYKVSKRKDLDISTVSAAFRLKTLQGRVSEIILAYGGMAEITARALKTEEFLKGRDWTRETVESAMSVLSGEFTPISDARAGAEYRKIAGRNLLLKFYIETKLPDTNPDS